LLSQYDFYKVFPILDTDCIYYIPFVLTFFLLPFLWILKIKEWKVSMNDWVKTISHFLLIICPLSLGLLISNLFMLMLRYFTFFKEIVFNDKVGFGLRVLDFCKWFF